MKKTYEIRMEELNKSLTTPQSSISSRRTFISTAFLIATTTSTVTPSLPVMSNIFPFVDTRALAVMDASQPNAQTFKAGQAMGISEAKERFELGRKDLKYLLDNYDKITPEGGDGVRRYLGTVGVNSGLYGISKVLKELQGEAEDIVEYTESMNEFDSYLRAADTSCYSANFVEFSAAKTKPEKFFDDAKSDATQMQKAMDAMAAQLGL